MIGRYSLKKGIVIFLIMFIFIEIAFTKEYTIKYEVQDEEQEEYIEINYVANDAELHKNIIFNDFLRSSTYDAFFICDNGDEKTKYKIWDASKSEWSTVEQYSIAYAENETLGFKDYKAERLQAILISHIKSLNNSLSNLNVGYEGEDNHLLELGFLQINNEKSLIKNEGTTIDNLQIYNSESGIFIFNVEYPDGENSFCKCIKFRDGNSILELKKKLNEKKSDDDCFKYFISYMDESKRNSLNDVEKAIGKEIARSIYMSLYATHTKSNGVLDIDGDMNILLNLYDSQDNYFVKEYLKLCYEEKLPVFATIYNAYQNDYKPRANEFIDGNLFAKYALTYLFSGPEYNSSFEFNHDSVLNKIYNKYSKDGYEKYFSEFFPNLTLESIRNKDRSIKKYMAYPIPYVKSGIDTPRTFWKKMSTQETGKYVKTTNNKAYNPNRYKPGESAGTDSWGMISGILSEMSLSNDFKYFSKSGLLSLKDYSEYLGEITENSIINNSTLSEYRIDSSRLKEMSVIVPEFSKISVGDIIEYEYSNNEKNVAVVVGFSNTGSVSSKSDVLIVQLDSESKQAVLKTWAELKPDNSVVRRLFKYGASDTYNCSYWDVFDSKIIEKDISIETMKELTQKSTEKYRWMPNTGEYLVLKKIKLNAYNKAGISINDNLGKVRLIGAKDRNFTNNNTQAGLANIYNNKASKFEGLVYTNDITNPIYKFEFERTSTSEYLYNVKVTFSNKPEATTVDFDLSNGYLSINGQIVSIGIRPESASKAYPGDDLILQFGIGSQFGEILSAEKDYVAVYDKKMLWRANLYIEKNETQLGGIDWNAAHPWNVRPIKDDDNFADPWWWSYMTDVETAANTTNTSNTSNTSIDPATRWGCNEWNRELKNFDVTAAVFKGLNDLPAGDGKQVINLLSFTPIRTIGGSMSAPSEKNYIQGTVAYSYPEHSKEKGLGASGSMDSPFDYVKKLMYQEKQLNKWFATNTATERNAQETPLGTDHWIQTKAPLNSWYMYEKTSTTDTSGKMFLPSYGLMLYNSGYSQNTIVNGDTRVESTVVSDYLEAGKDTIIEAGTDCLGFASRAASYSGNKYKWFDVPKGWTEYSSGNGTNKISDVLNNYGQWPNANGRLDKDEGTRTYPWADKDGMEPGDTHSYNIFTTRNYDSNAYVLLTDTVKNTVESKDVNGIPNAKKKLMSIVPGDIFVKCSKDGKPTTNNKMDSHIAIVAYVPENADEMTVEQLLNSIVLIEAEYGWRVQSVIKSFTLGTYHGLEKPLDVYDDIYGKDASRESGTLNSTMKRDDWSLNNRHFAIRRLICN